MTSKLNKKIGIVGSGVGGLASACLLAKKGYEVTVLEKNSQIGGRMGVFESSGFMFDTGPSWYLMPEVFEKFYNLMGEKVEDSLNLIKLEPSYRVFFENDPEYIDVRSDRKYMEGVFEKIEKGGGKNLNKYLSLSEQDYRVALDNFIYRSFDEWTSLFELRRLPRLSLLGSMHNYIEKFFKNPKLQKILEFQLVFLGSSPYNAPAIYNLMNHIDIDLGVFYPMGGMYKLAESMKNLAEKNGAKFHLNSAVTKIRKNPTGKLRVEIANKTEMEFDTILANADIHHVETQLLEKPDRSYSNKYWDKIILAPSAHVMYLGVKRQYSNLLHHNLFFSEDWKKNFAEIFDNPVWPTNPSIYVSATSKTDPSSAPEGYENLFVLTPISSKLKTSVQEKKEYGDKVLELMEKSLGLENLRNEIVFRKDYSSSDYAKEFNALGGSALGISHVLQQSLFLRPRHRSKKLPNLIYVGAGTTPGIGLPMQIISAEIACRLAEQD